MFIEQSQIQTLPFQFSIFYDYSTEKKKKEKKHAIFHSCISNSSVVNVDVRMVITTTPLIGFPAESVAQGGMHLRTTVMIPPQQLWLGLSLTLSATFPAGDYSLVLFPSTKLLDTAENCLCLLT